MSTVMSLYERANQLSDVSLYFPATTDSWSLMRPSPSSMVSRDSRPSSTVTAETDSPPADGSSIWKHITPDYSRSTQINNQWSQRSTGDPQEVHRKLADWSKLPLSLPSALCGFKGTVHLMLMKVTRFTAKQLETSLKCEDGLMSQNSAADCGGIYLKNVLQSHLL